MEVGYPQDIELCQAYDAWQTGPIALECCGYAENWGPNDGPRAFQWAIDEWLSEYQDMIRVLGYRLMIRSLTHPVAVSNGGRLLIDVQLENVGVAPCYFDYRLAIRLGQETIVTDSTIRYLLPGSHTVNLDLQLPANLPPGDHQLSVGVVDPADQLPAVRLAVEGRDADGWYPLSTLTVF
jgi:hypothetical protein